MKTVKVTITLEMEAEDPKDEETMREAVYSHLEDLIGDEALEFTTKVIASDDDEGEPEFEDEDEE